MRKTTSSDTTVAMKIDINPPLCESCNSAFNFVVHLTCHDLRSINFRPVLDYSNEKSRIRHRSRNGYHLYRKELQTFDTIIEAVDEILYNELSLYDKLTDDDLLGMAEFIEMGKTLLLDEGEPRLYVMVAHIDIRNSYSFENILPSDALVPVKVSNDDDTDSCCAVCLEGFDEGGGDGDEVYRTCCRHMFHCGCIGKWLTKKSDCPLCRFQLVPDDSEKKM